jgi:hypothetical protein
MGFAALNPPYDAKICMSRKDSASFICCIFGLQTVAIVSGMTAAFLLLRGVG